MYVYMIERSFPFAVGYNERPAGRRSLQWTDVDCRQTGADESVRLCTIVGRAGLAVMPLPHDGVIMRHARTRAGGNACAHTHTYRHTYTQILYEHNIPNVTLLPIIGTRTPDILYINII